MPQLKSAKRIKVEPSERRKATKKPFVFVHTGLLEKEKVGLPFLSSLLILVFQFFGLIFL